MIGMPRLLTPDGDRGSAALAMVDRRSTAFGSMVKPDGPSCRPARVERDGITHYR